jgi:hypothetical protein
VTRTFHFTQTEPNEYKKRDTDSDTEAI